MKQLDLVVSPPAFLWSPLTFDPDPHDLWPWYVSPFYLVIFGPMNYFLVTDGQTDRRRRIRAHRAWTQVGSKMGTHTHTLNSERGKFPLVLGVNAFKRIDLQQCTSTDCGKWVPPSKSSPLSHKFWSVPKEHVMHTGHAHMVMGLHYYNSD